MNKIIHRNNCRLCGGKKLELVVKLAPTPIGDAYVLKSKVQECYPLELFLCKDCGLAQLLEVIDPEAVYGNYIYHTSDSFGLVKHFGNYADSILHRINPPKNSLAMDIGSNDGSLLKFFKKGGMRVLGIDPAKEIARKATESGIETLPTFFTLELARKIKSERGSAHIITTNNTFANVDDLTNMITGIRELLSPDGIFVFETGYFLDLIQKTIFDNIYHEHLSYFSIKPLENFFLSKGMELIDVERVPTKGGSIRCIVQLKGGSRKVSPSVNQLIKLETELGINDVETIKKFGNKLETMKNELAEILENLKSKGKTVVGYGASVGVTTMLYYLNLDRKILKFIVDDNPMRQNLYSPGLHIPILSSQAIYERKPDYVLLLAWQYSEPIMKKNQKYLEQGGHFILLLPSLQVVNNKGVETKQEIMYHQMYEYYNNQEELPTHGNFKSFDDLESYDLERQNLFIDKLFLPPSVFQNAKLIEFGPDSGENSLVFARWGASCKLIEPNPKAHPIIKDYFKNFKLSDKLDKLVLSDLLSYSEYLKPSEKFDIIDSEGFIYTIRPESLWISIFNHILKDNGFVIIYYCEAFGSFMELLLKAIHTRTCELTSMGDLEAAQKLFAAKWKSIPHKRSMKSWVFDILKNPYVRLHYFFEPQSLCRKMSEAGFSLYSSWPSYKDGSNVHWFKKKLNSEEQLRLQDDFIARSRISHMFGRKNFIVDLDTNLEKNLFNLLSLIDDLIDNFDKDKAMQCMECLSTLEKFINSNKILVDPKETIDTVQTIQSIQHIFQLLVEGNANDVIEFCNKDKPFISSWGTPSHFAVFRKRL